LAAKGQVNCHCCQSDKIKRRGHYRNKNFTVQRFECLRCGKAFSEKQPLDGLRVDINKACQVVHLLCEGMGIRAIERLTQLNRRTVLNILETAGQKASEFQDAKVYAVDADLIQADEINSFVYSKQRNTDDNNLERGDQYTFLSVDKRSKLIINALVGKRTRENAEQFLIELKRRMAPCPFQLTTDNWQIYSGYTGAVRAVFGQDVNYATETKYYARPAEYLPRRLIRIKRKSQIGEPDMAAATTCHAERTNLSVRTFTRRFTRCTLGYSKKLENMKQAVALFVWHFNFARLHSAHGRTPAQAAGLVSKAFTISELLTTKH
jgi:transposase-like protein/IS1 family transposase